MFTFVAATGQRRDAARSSGAGAAAMDAASSRLRFAAAMAGGAASGDGVGSGAPGEALL